MKLCKTRAGTPSHSPSSARAHVSSSEQDTQNLEMLENVAYGHLFFLKELISRSAN